VEIEGVREDIAEEIVDQDEDIEKKQKDFIIDESWDQRIHVMMMIQMKKVRMREQRLKI
jgi:hypothetical protein